MIKSIVLITMLLVSTCIVAEEQKVTQYRIEGNYVIEFTPRGNLDYICVAHRKGLSCIPKKELPIEIEFEDSK